MTGGVGASPPAVAALRSSPAALDLPPALRWSGLLAAAGAGAALGAGIGLVALVRRDRPMHAVGRTYHAALTPLTSARESGVLWLDTLGPRDGLVRFSRGAGLPPWAPDVQGVAVSSYQGGHVEYFEYLVDLLNENGAGHIKVVGGGGGVIVPEEIARLRN